MGLLDGAGNFIGSLFGSGGGPSRQVADLDPTTKKIIDTVSERGMRPEGDIEKEGYGLAREAAAQVSEQKDIGGYNPMMGDAIRMKYQEATKKDLAKLKLMSEMQSKQDKSQQMRSGWEMLMAKQNVATQNFARAAEARMQSEMLRAQVLSSVFQGAGRIAGAYYGSNNRGLQIGNPMKLDSQYEGGFGGAQTPPTPSMDFNSNSGFMNA